MLWFAIQPSTGRGGEFGRECSFDCPKVIHMAVKPLTTVLQVFSSVRGIVTEPDPPPSTRSRGVPPGWGSEVKDLRHCRDATGDLYAGALPLRMRHKSERR